MGNIFSEISAVDYWLPANTLTNDDISNSFPQWTVEKISKKTGISVRHIAAENEYSSDLAANAAKKLFRNKGINPSQVEFVILCTQTPDYFMPTTAALVQEMVGIPMTAGALDVNLGCSGYVYSLGLAKGLIESGQVGNVLVLTADTYSKFLNPEDKSVRTIFGDGASATFVTGTADQASLAGFSFGTDGSGGKHLMVPNGGLRPGNSLHGESMPEDRGLASNGYDLYMNGPEIFNFTLRVIPGTVEDILKKANLSFQDIDLFVFHQANAYMLEHLRKKLGVDDSKFFVFMKESGNTVSSTIPIALTEAEESGSLKKGMKVMLLGFGVGLSWGGLVAIW
jgi:3-oxoacyl-[acyl-carrier-protein] synthase-3